MKQTPGLPRRISLSPDHKAVRHNQDDRAYDCHPVDPVLFLLRPPLPPEIHGESDDQEYRDEMLFQQIGHCLFLPFPRRPDLSDPRWF